MKNLLFKLTLVFCSTSLWADIGPQGFKDFLNHYFVETGTHKGAGIKQALKDGFREVISMDNDAQFIDNARKMFKGMSNVKIFWGDTSKDLWPHIKDLDEEVTFWLDAHNIHPVQGQKNTALIGELEQIKRHHIKTHTILIDDMECLGTLYFDFLTRAQLIAKIKEINPDYEISYMQGGHSPLHTQNVMIAKVR